MESKHVWALMAIAIVIGVSSGFLVWSLTSGYLQLYSGMIGSIIIFGIVFLSKFRLKKTSRLGRSSLLEAANELRTRGFWVMEKEAHVNVRISRWTSVDLLEQGTGSGRSLAFRASAPDEAWILVMISYLVWVVAPVGAVLGAVFALYSLYRTKRFAEMVLMVDSPASEIVIDPTRAKLIEALSEARQLADEAMRSIRSNHQDLVLIMAVIGLITGFAVYFALFILYHPLLDPLVALGIGALVAILLPLSASLIAGQRNREEIRQRRISVDKLHGALAREMSGKGPGDGEETSIELLFASYEQLPDWMKARRRAGMYRSPGTWALIFFMVVFSGVWLLTGFLLLFVDPTPGIVLLLISSFILAISYRLYRAWKRKENEEEAGIMRRFASRFDSLQKAIESRWEER